MKFVLDFRSRGVSCPICRVLEDNKDAIELKNKLSGSFAFNLNTLMEDGGFSINQLAKSSKVDNGKISKILEGSAMSSLVDCMRFCAAFELHPIVAHQLLSTPFELEFLHTKPHARYRVVSIQGFEPPYPYFLAPSS